MKRTVVFLGTAILVFAFLVAIAPIAKAADAAPDGAKLFVDKKCNSCHSIDSQKITKKLASSKAPDLSNIGATQNAEWLTKWLNKEVDLDGKKHPAVWSGKPEEQKALVDWLATLKTAK